MPRTVGIITRFNDKPNKVSRGCSLRLLDRQRCLLSDYNDVTPVLHLLMYILAYGRVGMAGGAGGAGMAVLTAAEAAVGGPMRSPVGRLSSKQRLIISRALPPAVTEFLATGQDQSLLRSV